MIAKKNSRANLERKRVTFFNIGLLGAGSLVLAAFTYTSPLEHEKEMAKVEPSKINYIQEYVEEKKPKPIVIKQKVKEDTPKTTPNPNPILGDPKKVGEQYRETDNKATSVDPTVSIGAPGDGWEEDPLGGMVCEEVVEFADTPASFLGGYIEMTQFIQSKMEYPEIELMQGIGRKVYVYFVVEKDGTISNIKIENPEGDGLDREAKRVIKLFPKWKPGEVKGKKVRTSVVLPITFNPM